jgi:hypothetical protein
MRSTYQNSGTALSIGVFFSLMIVGLASTLPRALAGGLQRLGVPHGIAHQIGSLPPVSSLFAAVLGVNPVQHLLAARGALSSLPAASQRVLTGRQFFPELISGPFQHEMTIDSQRISVAGLAPGSPTGGPGRLAQPGDHRAPDRHDRPPPPLTGALTRPNAPHSMSVAVAGTALWLELACPPDLTGAAHARCSRPAARR